MNNKYAKHSYFEQYAYVINYFITDHLGSTRVVINNNRIILGANDYYPFGKLWEGATVQAPTTRYLFNGKEKQTTGNLNYMDYGARMYDDFTGRWFVIDPLAEKYYFSSAYNYCFNNPLKYVDPDGRDIWEVNAKGQVNWKEESKQHVLYTVNNEGKRTDKSVVIKDRGILDQLSKSKEINKIYSDGYVEKLDSRTAIIGKAGAEDMLNLFMFMSDNTSVEWDFSFSNVNGENKYGLNTLGDAEQTRSSFPKENIITTIHSHPDIKDNIKTEQSSMSNDRYYSKRSTYNKYVYFPTSTRLYNLKDGKSNYVRSINRNPKRFINVK